MVTDLIKIPCVKNLLFRDHLHSYPESILNITSHNIIISHKQPDGEYKELWVSEEKEMSEVDCNLRQIFYTNIDAVQPKFQYPQSSLQYYTIVIRLKTLETCYFDIPNGEDAMKLTESLVGLMTYSGK